MANIKISELNELETRNDEDLLAIVDTNNNETKKIKVETLVPENFELKLIADEEPEHGALVQGECYYNTTTNKIYRYVGSNTYVDLGEPKTGILYIIFSEKATFAYDGETMVSVGGGSGSSDIVIIGDESETTEDTKLLVDTSGTTDTLKYKDNNIFTELQIKALDSNVVGTILPYAGTTLPDNYMFCNGDAISRTTYSALFNAIGTTYGAGDGSTTFNLPNLKGKVPVGLDGTDTDFDTIGKTGGSKYLQEHSHNVAVGWNEQGSDLPSTYYPLSQIGPSYAKYVGSGGSGGNFLKNAGTGDSGNLQPYIVVNYIIKVAETTPISSEVVNTFSNSTKDAYSCDYVNDLVQDVYSTDEVKTNKTWIDGKPIYRKCFNITAQDTAHNISNLGDVIFESAISYLTDYYGHVDLSNDVVIQSMKIWLKGAALNNLPEKIKLIIEYTKTTD